MIDENILLLKIVIAYTILGNVYLQVHNVTQRYDKLKCI